MSTKVVDDLDISCIWLTLQQCSTLWSQWKWNVHLRVCSNHVTKPVMKFVIKPCFVSPAQCWIQPNYGRTPHTKHHIHSHCGASLAWFFFRELVTIYNLTCNKVSVIASPRRNYAQWSRHSGRHGNGSGAARMDVLCQSVREMNRQRPPRTSANKRLFSGLWRGRVASLSDGQNARAPPINHDR